MMSKTGIKAAGKPAQPGPGQSSPEPMALSEEDKSKDAFFGQVAAVAEAMIARHGEDFATGTLLLAAKFVAEGKSLRSRTDGGGDKPGADKPV
jgi:hypothetical protein